MELKEAKSTLRLYQSWCKGTLLGDGDITPEQMSEAIDVVLAEVEKEKWISVKDKLPTVEKHGNKVLIYRETTPSQREMALSIYDTKMMKYCDESTFWMKLPSPPQQQPKQDICVGCIREYNKPVKFDIPDTINAKSQRQILKEVQKCSECKWDSLPSVKQQPKTKGV